MISLRYLIPTAILTLANIANAASPQLASIIPHGMQRGTEQVITFNGTRLSDAQEILCYYPGTTVTKLEVVSDTRLNVTLKVDANCRIGEHLFRVRTATGVSDARTFWIGALPVVNEVEPNSEFDKPQAIALNSTVHGSIGAEDVDYYVVECKKGQRLSVEVEGNRLGLGFWDPFIAILNDKRFELVTNDDNTLTQQDPGCSVLIPADGKYTVMIRESAYGAGTSYRMHIGNFPRPTAVLPSGGKPGEEIEFRFIGDPKGEFKQKIKLPAEPNAMFRLHCETPDGIMPTGFKVQMNDLPNVIESGANITPAAATAGVAPCAFNGVVSKNAERKHFKFAAKKGQAFEAYCRARVIGSQLDSVMTLTRTTGQVLLTNDDTGGSDSYFRFNVPDDGEYVIYVEDHLKKGGPDYFFRIEISPIIPSSDTNIPKVDGNNRINQDRQNITVPKGGRYATMVLINRSNWSGNTYLQMPNMPSGVEVKMPDIEGGFTQVPVVFEARTDAVVGGQLVDFQAVPAEKTQACTARTSLDIAFNPGQNNYPYHKLIATKIAVAITETCPYSIEVIEPKAPIPQNSSYNLRIVAKRAPGFTGAINVAPLYAPPGIGIINSAVIKEGETETTLNVNAAGNAALRKWQTAVTASADTGKGLVYTSSQLFTLEVGPSVFSYAQERATVEQGQQTEVFGKFTVAVPFTGEADAKLIGLPTKATSPDVKIKPDSAELRFPVTTDKTTPAGKHSVFVIVTVKINGETFYQTTGGSELRVDVPLVPKTAPTTTPTTPGTTPKPATLAKPLSKLEQLRLEQEEKEKAAKSGQKPPEKK